jgi:MerR family transcriptional regulator, thiopeptide resistance regulator
MVYSVKKLAELSGVSVRTLHFYDEIGLLRPAYTGQNGYRYYKEPQLLLLQQILFFKELGFELKKIKKILARSDFDKMVALCSHRSVLQKEQKRLKGLVHTIDQTVKHLKGEIKMKTQEFYGGFSREKQALYEKQLIERFGETMEQKIAESHASVRNWSAKDWEKSRTTLDELCQKLTLCMQAQKAQGASEVQALIELHYEWLKQFWLPTKETYMGFADLYREEQFAAYFAKYDLGLAVYLSEAMKYYAQSQLED